MTDRFASWLHFSNAATALSWTYVVLVIVSGWNHVKNNEWCETHVSPAVRFALYVSCLEFVNALLGITRSKPWQVLLFASVRLGVEVSQLVECSHHTHLLTVTCWAVGDTIRFGCNVFPSSNSTAKWIRYNVGCLLFPIGAFGEMWMVYSAGYFYAAALWPVGFVPLYRQLLKQRHKFMSSQQTSAGESSSKKKL